MPKYAKDHVLLEKIPAVYLSPREYINPQHVTFLRGPGEIEEYESYEDKKHENPETVDKNARERHLLQEIHALEEYCASSQLQSLAKEEELLKALSQLENENNRLQSVQENQVNFDGKLQSLEEENRRLRKIQVWLLEDILKLERENADCRNDSLAHVARECELEKENRDCVRIGLQQLAREQELIQAMRDGKRVSEVVLSDTADTPEMFMRVPLEGKRNVDTRPTKIVTGGFGTARKSSKGCIAHRPPSVLMENRSSVTTALREVLREAVAAVGFDEGIHRLPGERDAVPPATLVAVSPPFEALVSTEKKSIPLAKPGEFYALYDPFPEETTPHDQELLFPKPASPEDQELLLPKPAPPEHQDSLLPKPASPEHQDSRLSLEDLLPKPFPQPRQSVPQPQKDLIVAESAPIEPQKERCSRMSDNNGQTYNKDGQSRMTEDQTYDGRFGDSIASLNSPVAGQVNLLWALPDDPTDEPSLSGLISSTALPVLTPSTSLPVLPETKIVSSAAPKVTNRLPLRDPVKTSLVPSHATKPGADIDISKKGMDAFELYYIQKKISIEIHPTSCRLAADEKSLQFKRSQCCGTKTRLFLKDIGRLHYGARSPAYLFVRAFKEIKADVSAEQCCSLELVSKEIRHFVFDPDAVQSLVLALSHLGKSYSWKGLIPSRGRFHWRKLHAIVATKCDTSRISRRKFWMQTRRRDRGRSAPLEATDISLPKTRSVRWDVSVLAPEDLID